MELKTYFAQDASGNIMPGAAVTVYIADTLTLATGLLDENESALTNPFNADSDAKVAFYAPDGLYDINVVSGIRSVTIRAQFVGIDAAIVLRDDLAETSGATLVGADDSASGTLFTTVAGFISRLRSSAGSALVGFIQGGTGAVARTVQGKLRECVSITDFAGLVSSGDWTAAGIAAAESLPSGGVVYLPPGQTYRFEELPYYTGVYFVGAGKGATIVEAQSAKSIFGKATTSSAVHHCGVIGMTVIGRRSVISFPVDDADGNALRLNQVSYGTFRDLLIQETIFNGVSIYNNSNNNLFEDVECRDVGKSGTPPGAYTMCGFFIEAGSSRNRLVRPRVNVAAQYGIWIGARDADNYDNEIIDPWIASTIGDAIHIGDEATSYVCHRPKITHPRIFGAGSVGIRLFHAGTGAVREAEIIGGHIEGCADRGIYIGASADHTRVIGTRLKGNGSYNFENSGTNSVYWVESSGASTAEIQDSTTDSKRVVGSNPSDGRQGSFTPQVLTGGAAVGRTYSNQQGSYRVNGNRVEFNLSIAMTAKGSSTGALTIGGLPFTSKSTGAFNAPNVQLAQVTYTGTPFGLVLNSSTAITLYTQASASSSTPMTDAALGSASEFYISGSYEI